MKALYIFIGIFTWLTTLFIFKPETGMNYKFLDIEKGDSYEAIWKKIDSLDNLGLPKSAMDLVTEVIDKARKDKNHSQEIKALMFTVKYSSMLEEKGFENSIRKLETASLNLETPSKQILHSIIAELYWLYYSQNRYRVLNRSHSSELISDDIATWDAQTLLNKIISEYMNSLNNEDSLKQIRIDIIEDIIEGNSNFRHLRPTIYDFLAHRAIDFFSNTESALTRPADEYLPNDPKLFENALLFSRLNIPYADSLSLNYYSVKLFQQILAFHLPYNNPDIIVDADLKRLKYLYHNSPLLEKDSLYINQLKQLKNKYINDSASGNVSYNIALFYSEKSRDYNHLNSPNLKWYNKIAAEECLSVIEKFPETIAAKNCEALLLTINAKSINITGEKYITANNPSLIQLSWRNIDTVYVAVYKVNHREYFENTRNKRDEEQLNYILSLPKIHTQTIALPNDNDYNSHTAEFALPAFSIGEYIVMLSNNKAFEINNNGLSHFLFSATNLSYFYNKSSNGDYDFRIVNRQSGIPEANVNAELWQEEYNYKTQKQEFKKIGDYKSNKEGYFKIPPVNKYRAFRIHLNKGNDRLYSSDYFYQNTPQIQRERKAVRSHFFTDRSIYRPGQTVHFKGIVYETLGKEHSILTNHKTTVIFYNANYQKVSSLDLVTNEFGSISGSFTIPNDGITGSMRITDNYGTVYFSVEEYKRPQFEVMFEPIKDSYKLNSKVDVTGNAKSYAGANIDNANVKYSVSRQTWFPFYNFRFFYPPVPAPTIISHGNTTTDSDGNFIISFEAKPDPFLDAKTRPAFNFIINVDITDINGETRSGTTTVSVGYDSYYLSSNLLNENNLDEMDSLKIFAYNLSGERIKTSGNYKIFKLSKPKSLKINRLWAKPEHILIDENTFKKDFSLYEWDNENDVTNWEKEKKIIDKKFETDLIIDNTEKLKLESGYYLIEANAKNEKGEEATYSYYFKVYSPVSGKMPFNELFKVNAIKNNCEPGENAKFLISSSEKNIRILYQIEFENKFIKEEWITLTNEQKLIEIPVEEKHRGGFSVHFSTVKYSRFLNNNIFINVPFSNKELKIDFATFRDKLYPGEEEEWRITISGKNGEKIASEMVATLYDASLDAFKPHSWHFWIYQSNYSNLRTYSGQSFSSVTGINMMREWNKTLPTYSKSYENLNWFGMPYFFGYFGGGGRHKYSSSRAGNEIQLMATMIANDDLQISESAAAPPAEQSKASGESILADKDVDIREEGDIHSSKGLEEVQIRSNLNETAFFYPLLRTNENGEIIVSFKVPEALTRWKMLGIAHSKDLKLGSIINELITQKELMVVPNLPRFMRENDKIVISSKIQNLSNESQEGKIELLIFDAVTMNPINDKFGNTNNIKDFKIDAGKSGDVTWELKVPEQSSAITVRIVAKSDKFSDGEERILPVLTNRMLVTETLPLPIRTMGKKDFSFNKLLKSAQSSTLKHHKLTLEYTANPAWYAIQALPYIIETNYENSEQIFARFYANSLASHIANSNPKIKRVFDIWRTNPDSKALLSNLEKNQELKYLLLEETPWVMDAQDESERKKRIALLFDINNMSHQMENTLNKLIQLQSPNGGWVWFKGGRDDRHITQHIITGFGHLYKLNVINNKSDKKINNAIEKAVYYLDREMQKTYDYLIENFKKDQLEKDNLNYFIIQYLYARSFFINHYPINNSNKKAWDYYLNQAKTYWYRKHIFSEGMIALALHRLNEKDVPEKIINSLKERALQNEEMGMYWKENSGGYYWWQAPIETHALMIEVFDEIANDQKSVNELRTWLLKQKQVQDWKTTKATTKAVYALLLRGNDWLSVESDVIINLGSLIVNPKQMPNVKEEAGTGYFKTSWDGSQVKAEMGNITVEKADDGVSWGAVYWQYFEQLDKITSHETPLKLNKKLFVEKMTDRGKTIVEVKENESVKIGDKIIVRIELRVDRDMEYIHMKDMRASGFEPINVLSNYKWRDGLGYYESTRDASTNFFFDRLPKGTYVFEYPLRASVAGDFSNGITTIQCMYAPEFSSHSDSRRIIIK